MTAEVRAEIFSWIKVIIAAVAAAFIINNFVIVHASVPTGSMMDTIPERSRIVAFRLSYLFSDPQRLDVVVFEYPDSEPDNPILYVKRIIGMPGETVQIIDGKVYINDNPLPLEESTYVRNPPIPTGNWGPYVVPEGCYFMMGDNRNNSEDSRYWYNTYLEKGGIIGKLVFSYYPQAKLIK